MEPYASHVRHCTYLALIFGRVDARRSEYRKRRLKIVNDNTAGHLFSSDAADEALILASVLLSLAKVCAVSMLRIVHRKAP